jgi:hypothetical protein
MYPLELLKDVGNPRQPHEWHSGENACCRALLPPKAKRASPVPICVTMASQLALFGRIGWQVSMLDAGRKRFALVPAGPSV